MTLRIVDYLANPKPLRRIAREVRPEEIPTDEFQRFVRELAETMFEARGLALAATQVDATAPDGEVWRLFVMRGPFTPGGNPEEWTCFVNPRIVRAIDFEWGVEGCLSFRSVHATMRAPGAISAEYLNEEGKAGTLNAVGIHARAFAHEEEHLRGKLLIDRMNRAERERFLRNVGKARKPAMCDPRLAVGNG